MIGRVVVLDRMEDGRAAAALMVDGRLEDLVIDPKGESPLQPGAILRGVVDRLVKGQGGVFVKLPGGSGFLRQVSGLAPGQRVIVQVSGVAEPGKAVPVTLRVLFKSQLAIATPGAPGINISRRIRDEELRQDLQDLADEAMKGAPATLGLIIRSAAEAAGEDAVAEDILSVKELATAVMADLSGGPELLVDAPDAHELAWREWTDPAPDEVVEGEGAFERSGVLDAIDDLRSVVAELPAGGSMVLETTRALVAVDINTGPDTSLAAGLKANIAAARDLPRQLRLRGLGGQIVVDFAPMPKKDRGTLEQVLRAAFKGEAAESTLAGWTPLGNFELQRKRDRAMLKDLL
ncbi:ribonuclease E/G [Falsigemmobacter intermedius]|uniref:Ribonuclease G n=1 Tax=Falsigemmobacter intermedius TaxID=1553448 RepID=A0A3S3UEI6_9RHOB|nr:ribonuclease E/G [Falsigemmobacter intermedius]RWY40033.1 ribonuclease G [Falsigemmobacter intermedius]